MIVIDDTVLFAAVFRMTAIDTMPHRGRPQTVGTTCSHNPSAVVIICFIHERWVFPVGISTQILPVAFISDLSEVGLEFLVQLVALVKTRCFTRLVGALSNVRSLMSKP